MNRRAKLDLSAPPAGRSKTTPDLDDGPTTASAALGAGAPERPESLRARQLVKALAVVAIGALCVYLLARRR